MTKTIVIIFVAVVVVLGSYFLLKKPEVSTPGLNQVTPSATVSAPVTEKSPPAEQNTVIYTDTGYSPNTLRVKTGATVTFKNESSRSMWSASAVHPTHKLYPATGGCIGSAFDACKGVQPGGTWSFKFDIEGTWKYHNHLSPSDTGSIVVEQ